VANTLTSLAADIYKAADIVGRELVGIVPSCTINADGSATAAMGDTVRAHFTRTPAVITNATPAMVIPEGTDQTVDNKTLTINKQADVQIPWTGEDIKHVNNGAGYATIYGDQIAQAMRSITNQIEFDLAVEAKQNASRAFGTAGTTPFGSNFDEIAEIRQILVDNGMPANDGRSSIVLSTTAGTNLRQLAQLNRVNEAGNDRLLRQGELLNLQGLMLKESAGIRLHTKGTGASYVTSGSTAPGVDTLALVTGSGTVLAGDVVTFAADSVNKYVVNVGVAAPGTITLGDPGARVTIATANAMTIGNSYTANVAFHQSALELAIRAPAMPLGGDAADDVMTVQDPWTGLVFEIATYKGFRKAMINVGCVYGVKAWKQEYIAILLG